MKTLLVHFAKDHGEGRIEIAGRCVADDIHLNDELCIEGRAFKLKVISIEVYGKQVEVLYSGYVGNCIFQMKNKIEPLLELISKDE
jgi:hypothetical protein